MPATIITPEANKVKYIHKRRVKAYVQYSIKTKEIYRQETRKV